MGEGKGEGFLGVRFIEPEGMARWWSKAYALLPQKAENYAHKGLHYRQINL